MADVLVKWSSEYNLGIDAIDRQHESLVELVNQVWESIVFRADEAKVMEILGQLERYTVAHFAAEEAYMQKVNYPDFGEHKRIHEAFIARVAAEKQAAANGGQLTLGLVSFLRQWLLEHILKTDKAFVEFTRQRAAARVQPAPSATTVQTEDEQPESLLRRVFKRFF